MQCRHVLGWTQLTLEQRHYINIACQCNKSMGAIAKDLFVSHTTISREIKRNVGKQGYRYNQANAFAQQIHQNKPKFVKLDNDGKKIISNCLKMDCVNKSIKCDSYFAKPYHSWERGQNKNANGLLRQYFPKVMPLVNIAIDDVKIAVNKLNSRPRKCLDFKTPY